MSVPPLPIVQSASADAGPRLTKPVSIAMSRNINSLTDIPPPDQAVVAEVGG